MGPFAGLPGIVMECLRKAKGEVERGIKKKGGEGEWNGLSRKRARETRKTHPHKCAAHPGLRIGGLRLRGEAAAIEAAVVHLTGIAGQVIVLPALRLAAAALCHDQWLAGLCLVEGVNGFIGVMRKAHDVQRIAHHGAGGNGADPSHVGPHRPAPIRSVCSLLGVLHQVARKQAAISALRGR